MTDQQETLYNSAMAHKYLAEVLKIYYLEIHEYLLLIESCRSFLPANDPIFTKMDSPYDYDPEVIGRATNIINFYKDNVKRSKE